MKNKTTGLIVLLFFVMTGCAIADCIGTVRSVTQDSDKGNIVVTTDYSYDDTLIETAVTKYDETNGAAYDIAQRVQNDVNNHCKNMILQIPENQSFIDAAILNRKKQLTSDLITNLQTIVGNKFTVTEASVSFKGKSINVTDSKNNAVVDAVSPN